MKCFGTAIILSMALAFVACGLSSPPNNALNGNWQAGLANPDGTTAFGFNATLAENSSTVNVTDLSFITTSSCFAAGTTATGTLSMTYTTHGVTSGAFAMTVQSGASNPNGMNVLTLRGNFVRNTILGTWTLTGTGLECSNPENSTSGSFSMTQMSGPSS
jgi:hypothetical protein